MIIQTNFLKQLIFQNPEELYSYLVDLLCQGISELKKENFSLSRARWKFLIENFNITDEDMNEASNIIKNILQTSSKVFSESGKFCLPSLWMNTITSLFFIIEPDIIEENSAVVESLWIKLYDEYYANKDNAITFLNITKI